MSKGLRKGPILGIAQTNGAYNPPVKKQGKCGMIAAARRGEILAPADAYPQVGQTVNAI